MENMTKQVERSLEVAISRGIIDPDKEAATIAGLRLAAEKIDAEGGDVNAAMLNAYLGFCKSLHMVPNEDAPRIAVQKSNKLLKFEQKYRKAN